MEYRYYSISTLKAIFLCKKKNQTLLLKAIKSIYEVPTNRCTKTYLQDHENYNEPNSKLQLSITFKHKNLNFINSTTLKPIEAVNCLLTYYCMMLLPKHHLSCTASLKKFNKWLQELFTHTQWVLKKMNQKLITILMLYLYISVHRSISSNT